MNLNLITMKKLFLMLMAAGSFSFATTSCDSPKENAAEEKAEAAEDAADDADMPAAEEAAEEAEDSVDAADPR
jgi:hypothetical protein